MGKPPTPVNIYHITHVDNLAPMIAAGGIYSHAEMNRREDDHVMIGNDEIKSRRLKLPVMCHPGTFVGDYVPFYFCPRSPMLYVINNKRVTYQGGQSEIVHLRADFHQVTTWAARHDIRWAVTPTNAGASYTTHYGEIANLNEINWDAISARYWSACCEHKQAEFLLHHCFPLDLVDEVGCLSNAVAARARTALEPLSESPTVGVQSGWYY